MAEQGIKGRTIIYQEQQRKIFCISFIIFIIVYIIILTFIGATFKFIKIIATVLAKGLPGMLNPFYSDSEGTRKGEESKQPIKLHSSFKLGDVIPTPIFVILRTDDP